MNRQYRRSKAPRVHRPTAAEQHEGARQSLLLADRFARAIPRNTPDVVICNAAAIFVGALARMNGGPDCDAFLAQMMASATFYATEPLDADEAELRAVRPAGTA